MNNSFKKCIERNKIVKLENAETLVLKELELAEEDLGFAKESLLGKGYKWTTIQSYYSMFHTARALLYNKGFREKSHFCLIESIRVLYVKEGLLNFEFVEALFLGKSLRENADYYGDFNKENAEELLRLAKNFLEETKNILK
ncbi:MAG: HEPN domain-containing protein [Candidatus Pacebacteria bacterium]|nr:HEPN domain-containing protein [Candidatus Paceibacterota bacterium]